MKIIVLLLTVIYLLFSCHSRSKYYIESPTNNKVNGSIRQTSEQPDTLNVSANLIYEDGTVSTFDVLNDKNIVLLNTIIGSGDALKPSSKTKINLRGNLDNLNLKIKNGNKLILDTFIMNSSKEIEYIINNTGCEKVYITIYKNKNVVYNDTIPFHCGE